MANKEKIESECEDAMCWFAVYNIKHEHPDPNDLTKAKVKVNTTDTWHGVWGTNDEPNN